jgi:hypothetical protein
MAAVTALFLLFAVAHGGSGVTLTQLASFNDKAACDKAAATVSAAVKPGTVSADFVCIRADALESLRPR